MFTPIILDFSMLNVSDGLSTMKMEICFYTDEPNRSLAILISFIFVKQIFSVYYYDGGGNVHDYTNSHTTE